MKQACFSLFTLVMFFSCSNESMIDNQFDFTGIFEASLECTGTLSDNNGETIIVIITNGTEENQYIIDLGDEVKFIGTQAGLILTIAEQTLNEGQEFDVITLSGAIKTNEDSSLNFVFQHEVDDEGQSNCNITLLNQ